jgi:hypothetical protein
MAIRFIAYCARLTSSDQPSGGFACALAWRETRAELAGRLTKDAFEGAIASAIKTRRRKRFSENAALAIPRASDAE